MTKQKTNALWLISLLVLDIAVAIMSALERDWLWAGLFLVFAFILSAMLSGRRRSRT